MFINDQELPTVVCIELRQQERDRRAVPCELLVCAQILWHSFSLEFGQGLPTGQGVRLSKEVGHELVVVAHGLPVQAYRLLALAEPNKICWDGVALMHQLIETMLSIGSGLTEINFTSLIWEHTAINSNTLPITFHVNLLDMCRESEERLAVREQCTCVVPQESCIPDAQKSHDHWNILLHGRGEVMLIHLMSPLQELLHDVRAIVNGKWANSHSAAHTVSASNPIPKTKHIVERYAKIFHFLCCSANCCNVLLCHQCRVDTWNTFDQPILHGASIQHRFCCGESL
mmetsp:Transcript_36977/g.47542  ORF Transcript_36977/g.47542 Transcript_36977/m.47542 type:complete len:286 (-) Transcript_36977:722-1579(-)